MRKASHYFLFGKRVWSVITETESEEIEEIEESEDTGGPLSSIVGNPQEPVGFGFTPWTPNWLEDED